MGYYDDPFDSFQYYDTPDDSAGGTVQRQNPFDQALQYYQAQRNPVESSFFWDENDPSYKAYHDLAAQPPESEGILRNYLSSMPTHDQYEPGVGRKIAGFLLGTLSGLNNPALAGVNAKKFIDDPYQDALQDWKNQGSNINLQARLADSARTRQIQSLKEGALNQFKAKHYADTSNQGGIRQASTNANRFVRADETEQRLKDADERQRFAESRFREMQDDLQSERARNADLRQQQLDRLQEALDNRVTNPSAHDLRANDPTEILRQEEAAKTLARQSAIDDLKARNHPFLKNLKTWQDNPKNEGKDVFDYLDEALAGINPQQIQGFKGYINNIITRARSKYQQVR